MRGYFALGAEGISKAGNVGTIMRTGHAFGASFIFTVNGVVNMSELRVTDTSGGIDHVPFYGWQSVADMALPAGCQLVGCELTDDASELPSFRHPLRAAYVFGPERGSLSQGMLERCDHVVKIPTKFCVNVSVAAAIVTYDRMISLGRFAERPVRVGGPREAMPDHVHGRVRVRNKESLRMRPLLGGWNE
ncbi:TrmH family RNA methyltransferase [Niveispirillum irakense]|uniref:TrmH family RNA methyltransferase n=1 Tax=Niveispirillum irakense TaxID=34011 RepID=UPI00048DB1AA|nr:TrmH family RNA methyltransferase [Niveispirillum irakense]